MEMNERSLDFLTSFIDTATERYSKEAFTPTRLLSTKELSLDSDEALAEHELATELDLAWDRAHHIFEKGQEIHGIVAGWNRGGLLVRWDKLQGFVPTSQLRDIPLFEGDESRDEKLARWVGEELSLRVIELDRSRNRLVFSERATSWGPRDGERLLREIAPGDIRSGLVSNLCDFGAFVDLGGIDGLIHISELSWGRVIHPREMLDIGQEVRVHVISVDRDNRRIALSLKRLHANPWATVEKRFAAGQSVTATITNVVDFGAFAQIEEGLEGLIHVTELGEEQIGHPSEVVQPGEHVLVRILRIDSSNHRLALSMKEVADTVLSPEELEEQDTESASAEWEQPPTFLY
jgi:small subunit ribosomal protein S1